MAGHAVLVVVRLVIRLGLVVGGGRLMLGRGGFVVRSGLMVCRSRGVVPETQDNINNMAKILQDPTTCTI